MLLMSKFIRTIKESLFSSNLYQGHPDYNSIFDLERKNLATPDI
jgi:hypothetical protein